LPDLDSRSLSTWRTSSRPSTNRPDSRNGNAEAVFFTDVECSEASYREALATAVELGMRPLVAHCHRGPGKFYRRTGDRQQAREHLAIATTMYREMDMRFWLEQAEAEMRELA
jgi:hypothetical protein